MTNPRATQSRAGMEVQSYLFAKQHFTKTTAREWLAANGAAAGAAGEAEDGDFWRYRQRQPDDFKRGSFRTIALAPDVKAVIGTPKKRKIHMVSNPRSCPDAPQVSMGASEFSYNPRESSTHLSDGTRIEIARHGKKWGIWNTHDQQWHNTYPTKKDAIKAIARVAAVKGAYYAATQEMKIGSLEEKAYRKTHGDYDDNPRRRSSTRNPAPQVAQEIMRQLGGNAFVKMTGARHIFGGENNLSFKLPSNFAKNGINYVAIQLTGRDDYDISFKKIRGMKVTDIADVTGIYADQLREVISEKTGLALEMPRVFSRNPKNPRGRKTANRTEARRKKNADIHIDIGSHNATPNPAINIPKTLVILGAALDMEIRGPEKNLLYSWKSPHQRGKRHAKKVESFVCSNTLGNELYIVPNTARRVNPARLIPLVERHRDAPDAARLYEKWADMDAHSATVLKTPRVSLHRIGTAFALSYYSDKWTGKTRAYIHKFTLEPEVYACKKSGIFTIFSKQIRVTADGIKG